MTLLGKILALVNILAALGFVYLAASDYAARRQAAYGVYRMDLQISGLPLNAEEKDVEGQDRVKDLSQATLTDLFQQAGGSPVKTQLEELDRVKAAVKAKIDGGDAITVASPLDPKSQLSLATSEQKRAWFLLPLARSLSPQDAAQDQPAVLDRSSLIAQMQKADQKPSEEDFERVFSRIQSITDPGDKRRAVAEALFSLVEPLALADGQQVEQLADLTGYKRFVVVVGLKAAVQAVDTVAAAQARMTEEADEILTSDRAKFTAEHNRMVGIIRDLEDQVRRANAALEAQRNQTARQDQLVKERETQVKDLESRLEAARKATKTELAKQAKVQEAVLAEQRKLRDANRKNQELLKTIESLEKQP
jgi:hypothetical protein